VLTVRQWGGAVRRRPWAAPTGPLAGDTCPGRPRRPPVTDRRAGSCATTTCSRGADARVPYLPWAAAGCRL